MSDLGIQTSGQEAESGPRSRCLGRRGLPQESGFQQGVSVPHTQKEGSGLGRNLGGYVCG